MYDIFTAMPWSNTIDVVTISGATLKKVLEHAVSQYDHTHPDPGGRFLQVSGLIIKFDIRKPIGSRLVSVLAGDPQDQSGEGWVAIEDRTQYEVAVPSFLATGGDRFQMIPDELSEYKNTGFLDNDLLVSYLKKNDPLELPASGRIVVVTSEIASTASNLISRPISFSSLVIFNALFALLSLSSILSQ